MATTLKEVKQTHKAILFESFNNWQNDDGQVSSKLDLPTALKATGDQDEKNAMISKLEVHSFGEFIEKFAPKIYENVTMIGDVPKFHYSFDNHGNTEMPFIKITDHAYFKYLDRMYSKKGMSGKSNREFETLDIREVLTPSQEAKDALSIKKELGMLLMQRTEAVMNHKNSAEVNRRIAELRKEIKEKAAASSLAKLSAYINKLENDILALEKKEEELMALPPGESVADKVGILDFEGGKPIVRELSSQKTEEGEKEDIKLLTMQNEINLLTSAVMDKDLKEASDFTKEMITVNYLPENLKKDSFPLTLEGVQEKKEDSKKKKYAYSLSFAAAQNEFIKALSFIMPKIMGVKIFFDHAVAEGADRGALPQNQGLLVANCTVAELLQDPNDKANFENYIKNYMKEQVGNNRIWLAILPHVQIGDKYPSDYSPEADLSDDPYAEAVKSKQKTNFPKPQTLSDASMLMNIMEEAGILTVINPAVADDAPFTFGGLTKTAIMDLKKKMDEEQIAGEHSVVAYPNFTLAGGENVPLWEGKEISEEQAPNINLNKFYIDASYVAAGLIVASQQPAALKKRGFKVDEDAVCVRVNLEDSNVASKFLTNFNCELSSNWSGELKDAVSDRFGFMFSGDANGKIKNTYVASARTMAKGEDSYYPIYKTLVSDFVLSYLKTLGTLTNTKFNNFVNKTVRTWREESKNGEKKGVLNILLHEDESIERGGETPGSLKIKMSNGDSVVTPKIEKE